MAGTPTGVWQIEDVHRGARWMPMGWPGHLRGGGGQIEDVHGGVRGGPGCPWGHGLIRWPGHLWGCGRVGTSKGEDLGAHGGMV